jgi:hypothetical protein
MGVTPSNLGEKGGFVIATLDASSQRVPQKLLLIILREVVGIKVLLVRKSPYSLP